MVEKLRLCHLFWKMKTFKQWLIGHKYALWRGLWTILNPVRSMSKYSDKYSHSISSCFGMILICSERFPTVSAVGRRTHLPAWLSLVSLLDTLSRRWCCQRLHGQTQLKLNSSGIQHGECSDCLGRVASHLFCFFIQMAIGAAAHELDSPGSAG